MGLKLIIGASGSGKSHVATRALLAEARRSPEAQFYCIVPEQFTMQTQKDLVLSSAGGGILNIDVLSFQRLAYRVFEEVGGGDEPVLEDLGKLLLIQKLIQEHAQDLPYLGAQAGKPGCLDEMKSLISEFYQYAIHTEQVDEMGRMAPEGSLLSRKLKDVALVYRSFQEAIAHTYVAAEEVLEELATRLPLSERVRGSVMVFDGFTGFTPVQLEVMKVLLSLCKEVRVTVTMDPKEPWKAKAMPHRLFTMSHQMITSLLEIAPVVEEPLLLPSEEGKGRFASSPALFFLERNLFRVRRGTFEGQQDEVRIGYADDPAAELSYVVREIHRLVREEGFTYGQIAVICGSLPEYGPLAREAFERAEIPCFIDDRRNVLMNPLVEYLRSAVEMVTKDFPYESILRCLRSGMTGISRSQIDRMDNYCQAKGIRGHRRLTRSFQSPYRGQSPEDLKACEEGRRALMDLVEGLYKAFSGRPHSVKEYCTALYRFLVASHAQQKLKGLELTFASQGNTTLQKECGQIYSIVLGLLEKMVEILGEEKIPKEDFAQLLETGLQKLSIGLIPASQDQVLFGDMERTRLKGIGALFFVGMNEGSIPKSPDTGGFLTQMDREFLLEQGITLAPDAKTRMNIGRFYLYLNMTKPSRRLYLSYALSNNKGEPKKCASLVEEVRACFPSLTPFYMVEGGRDLAEIEDAKGARDYCMRRLSEGGEVLSDPLFLEAFACLLREEKTREEILSLVDASARLTPSDELGRAVATALYGEISPYGATRLERYSACALSHFLIYGLRLSERVLFEFRSLDMGNLMHDSLQRFTEELDKRGQTWEGISDGERDALVEECVREASKAGDYEVLFSDARMEYSLERAQRLLKRTVWSLAHQLRNGSFEVDSAELAFEGGRIDRLDICREGDTVYVKIIDYKSGGTTFSLAKVYYGLQLQLMLYTDAAVKVEEGRFEGAKVVPAGVFYCNIKDPFLRPKIGPKEKSLEEQLLGELSLNGLVLDEADVVKLLDSSCYSLPAAFTTKGELRADSKMVSREQFALLGHYVRQKISENIEHIYEGDTSPAPYRLGKEEACLACPVKEACCFDRRLDEGRIRELENLERKEVLTRISLALEGKEESDGSAVDQ